ncbi:MAG: hypothetical protein WAM91_08160 [Candidatus Acidiferrales bacterium]
MPPLANEPPHGDRRGTHIRGREENTSRNGVTFWRLYAPALFVAAIISIAFAGCLLAWGIPQTVVDRESKIQSELNRYYSQEERQHLLEQILTRYQSYENRLDANVALQGLLIGTAILLIIRPEDSLKVFDNAVPLSWLHLFVAALLLYSWFSFGFVFNDLLWGRFQGVELIRTLHSGPATYEDGMFRDAAFVDGWFKTFVDSGQITFSGIDPSFRRATAGFLVIILGTIVSAGHASILAIVSVGWRRYWGTSRRRKLIGYCGLPFVISVLLIMSHLEFSYGGRHRNWIEWYVAVATVLIMMLFLRWSYTVDNRLFPESVGCLKRERAT